MNTQKMHAQFPAEGPQPSFMAGVSGSVFFPVTIMTDHAREGGAVMGTSQGVLDICWKKQMGKPRLGTCSIDMAGSWHFRCLPSKTML